MPLTNHAYIYILLTLASTFLFYYAMITYGFDIRIEKHVLLSLSIALQASALIIFNLEEEQDDYEECYGKCKIILILVSLPNIFSVILSAPFIMYFDKLLSDNNRLKAFIVITSLAFTIWFLLMWSLY